MDAGAWDALFRRGSPYHGPASSPFFATAVAGGARVLDLGCGGGKALTALRAAGPRWQLLGLDASRPALRLARRVAPVLQGNATALPLRKATVDAVRVDHLLGHLDPTARAATAREVERVLREGGALEVQEFAVGDLRDGVGREVAPRTFERGGLATHYFAPGELGALFARCEAEERVVERAVRFSARPRRVVQLRARRAW